MARQDLHSYPDEYYYPEALKSGVLTVEEMRKEYSRLRKLANQRLAALGRSEFSEHQSYLRNVGRFVPLAQITSERELVYKLYELKKFTSAKSGSVSGLRSIRKQTIETFHDRGWTFINNSNIKEFGDFMEECRLRGYRQLYGSERCGELFRAAKGKGVTPAELFDDFAFWMKNREELAKTPKIKNAKQRTSEQYKNAIENRNKKRR